MGYIILSLYINWWEGRDGHPGCDGNQISGIDQYPHEYFAFLHTDVLWLFYAVRK